MHPFEAELRDLALKAEIALDNALYTVEDRKDLFDFFMTLKPDLLIHQRYSKDFRQKIDGLILRCALDL